MTDPIADMLTRIRNASRVRKAEVFIPFSKIKLGIIKIMKTHGFIEGYSEIKPGEEDKFGGIMVKLKYENNIPAMSSLKRISKPGRRVYVAKDEMPNVLNNFGLAIISTSQGLYTNKEAKKMGLGGEVVCEIY
ncbi:MAG: 30S ribosomal protein S8 [Patescibacteria group bacterium]|jgi:small subunit ribosomal protein S8